MKWLFSILFFIVPLILWPYSSELFEFNKMVVVYAITVLTMAVWLYHSIIERKIIFRRTILDVPLLLFLGSQLISTVLSIDQTTSIFGYYSRFNGGLLSIVCYCLLYWAFVSNMDRKKTQFAIYSLLTSATLVSIYGVLEHFGIDKNVWVQDVQSRVFSTLGQPNWLAAFLLSLIPITWFYATEKKNFWLFFSLSTLFFVTILFTKSRSGLLGFVVTDLIFWAYIIKYKKDFLKKFLLINVSFLTLFFVIQNPITSKLTNTSTISPVGPALETGGTESGTIRKIVWKGAYQIFLDNPIFGTGPETFAYSYFRYRPIEHNTVSEWNFVYNKAHNEYLNIAANTGTFGILSYLLVLASSIFIFFKVKNYYLLAGYMGLLTSNFFGFSVVPNQLILFLFPAIAIALERNNNSQERGNKLILCLILLLSSYFLFQVGRYWYADHLYFLGKQANASDDPESAKRFLSSAIVLSPDQPVYHAELALSLTQENPAQAVEEITKAVQASPNNLNIKRSQFSIFIRLANANPNYLLDARDVSLELVRLAPTDPRVYYNLGLTYARLGELEKATSALTKAIELKPDYKEAQTALEFIKENF